MSLVVDLYWSFRSPYSYLATARLVKLRDEYDVDINVRPVRDGLAFLDEVSRLIWGGTNGWNEGAHLAEAASRAGFDLAELDAVVAAEPDHLVAQIEDNQKALEISGHWGVPTCVFEGEPFFGQDRLADLVWRLEQEGLKPRSLGE